MLVRTLLSLLIAVPLYSSNISPVQLRRVTSIAFFFAAALSINVCYISMLGSGLSLYSGLFHVSTVSGLFEVLIFLAGRLILLVTPSARGARAYQPGLIILEYPMVLVFTTIGASFLVSSSDLVSLYLRIELQSFAVYILATLYRNSESATSAGLKYFLLGALSSAFILLGSRLIYTYTGLTNLEAVYRLVASSDDSLAQSVNMAFIIMAVGFLFKVAAAPFHNWAPDVYDGVPTLVTTWLTVMPKISIFILLMSLFPYQAHELDILHSTISLSDSVTETRDKLSINVWQGLLLVCSSLSLVIGTVVGLAQTRIKRLLTYSTISHVGFMLLALRVSGQESIDAFLFYLVQYTLTNLNTFFILLAFGYLLFSTALPGQGTGYRSKGTRARYDVQLISDLSGQFRQNPLLALSMSLCLFSMAGIPPLMGFFAKYGVLYTSIHNGYYFVSLIAILASVISAAYYLRIVRVLYFDNTNRTLPQGNVDAVNLSSTHRYTIAVLSLLIMLFVLEPSLILNRTQLMAASIYTY